MLWDPFLIKKLLKSVICGTVNSTHIHCLRLTKSTIAGWKKRKKKKEKNVEKKHRRGFHCKPNGHTKSFKKPTLKIMITTQKSRKKLQVPKH